MKHLKLTIAGAVCALVFAAPAAAVLKPGAPAPDFSAQAYLAGEPFTFKLSDALSKGPVVLYFFPAAHTPGCNLEAHLFSEATDEFKAEGATVIGVTAGNVDTLAEFSKDTKYCGGKFAVAADPGHRAVAADGCSRDCSRQACFFQKWALRMPSASGSNTGSSPSARWRS